MPRSYYNKMFKGLLPPSMATTTTTGNASDDSGSDDGGATISTRSRKNNSSNRTTPYRFLKKAVQKAKLKHLETKQQRLLEERAQKLQAFRQTSSEFLVKVKKGSALSGGGLPLVDADTPLQDDPCPSQQLAVDCQGRQWTTKPKIVAGQMKFTTPKRYQPIRFDSKLPELDESCASLHVDLPDFEDHLETSEEAKRQEMDDLLKQICAAGLQDKAAAILAQMEAAANAAAASAL